MRPSHQSQHSRQRPAPSGRPMDCPACARRAGSLRDAGASTFVICVCPWPLENKVEQGINVTSAPEPGRHVPTATMETSRGRPGAPGVGLAMERPSWDGTSDTSSCQAPGRAGERGGWLAAQRPSGCHGSRGRRSVRCGRRNRAYFQAVYFQTSGVVDGRQWSVGAGQLAGTRGAVRIDVGGGGRRCTIKRQGWLVLPLVFHFVRGGNRTS